MAQEIVATFSAPTITATFGTLATKSMWTVVSTQTLSAGTTISVGSGVISIIPIIGDGAVTMTSTPTVQTSGTTPWHIFVLVGTDDTNTVKVQDESNLANSALHLANARDFTFGKNDILMLLFNGTDYIEISRSDNY